SLFRLVDDLTIGVLRLIPRDDGSEPPQVDLARINTSSLPALRAYMEGEALYRRMEFERAAEAYRRAVEADSGFVMARFRLGLARQWFWDFRLGQTGDPVIGAVGQYADRLPQHEAAMLRAIQVRHSDLTTARSLLEEEARRFPEDADTWYQLSELYFHLGPEALAPPEAATRALSRAIALDSSFSPPYLHRIECAIKERDIATIHR